MIGSCDNRFFIALRGGDETHGVAVFSARLHGAGEADGQLDRHTESWELSRTLISRTSCLGQKMSELRSACTVCKKATGRMGRQTLGVVPELYGLTSTFWD